MPEVIPLCLPSGLGAEAGQPLIVQDNLLQIELRAKIVNLQQKLIDQQDTIIQQQEKIATLEKEAAQIRISLEFQAISDHISNHTLQMEVRLDSLNSQLFKERTLHAQLLQAKKECLNTSQKFINLAEQHANETAVLNATINSQEKQISDLEGQLGELKLYSFLNKKIESYSSMQSSAPLVEKTRRKSLP